MTLRPTLIGGKRVASPEYRAWQAARNRVRNAKGRDFKYYGGRGILFHPHWDSFEAFYKDLGPRPEGYTLERRDCNKGYEPGNCYWATRQEQSRNRRFIQRYKGKTTWEWAEELGIKPASFHARLWKFRKGLITEQQLFQSTVSEHKCRNSRPTRKTS